MSVLYKGRYGDNLLEMDSAVAEVVRELEKLDIDDNTLIIFISDNGPHLESCLEGGDPGIFRGKNLRWKS